MLFTVDLKTIKVRIEDLESRLSSQSPYDTVLLPDFAAWKAGGRTLWGLTSPTYHEKNGRGRSLWMFGRDIRRSPETALDGDMEVGSCWPMKGGAGTLGIILAEPIVPRLITVDHIVKAMAISPHSAPRSLELWGLVRSSIEGDRLLSMDAESVSEGRDILNTPQLLSGSYASATFFRIAQFTYDIHAHRATQIFNVSIATANTASAFHVVMLVVRDNWGEGAYTCLYRVRIHGDPIST